MNEIVVGSRRSPLALAQTHLVCETLRKAFPELQITVREYVTVGDRRLDVRLATGEGADGAKLDKGLFTKELEKALLEGEIDAAVHSLKDLPGECPSGLEIAAIPTRAAWSDVLLSKLPGGFEALPDGALIGTSSPRRARQLEERNAAIRTSDIRGNVGTRLRKLREDAQWHGLALARAGLERLGYRLEDGRLEEFYVEDMGTWMLPAAGQGAMAVEVRAGDAALRRLLTPVHDVSTAMEVQAERIFLQKLGGGCQTPIGVLARNVGARLHLAAVVFSTSGVRRAEAHGATPEEVAEAAFIKL